MTPGSLPINTPLPLLYLLFYCILVLWNNVHTYKLQVGIEYNVIFENLDKE